MPENTQQMPIPTHYRFGHRKGKGAKSGAFSQLSAAAEAYTKDGSEKNLQSAYDVAADLSLARENGLLNKYQCNALDSMAIYHKYMQDTVGAAVRMEEGKPLTKGQSMAYAAAQKVQDRAEDYKDPSKYFKADDKTVSIQEQLAASSAGIQAEYDKLLKDYKDAPPKENEFVDGFKQTFLQVKEAAEAAADTSRPKDAGYPHADKSLQQVLEPEPDKASGEEKQDGGSSPASESKKESVKEPEVHVPSAMGGRDEASAGTEEPKEELGARNQADSPETKPEEGQVFDRNANIRDYIERFSRLVHDMNAVRMAEQGQPSVPWEEETLESRQSIRGEAATMLAGMRAAGYGFDFSKPAAELPSQNASMQAMRPDGSTWQPKVLDLTNIPPLSDEQKKEAQALSQNEIWQEFETQARELNSADSEDEAKKLSDLRESLQHTAQAINQGFQVDMEGASPIGQTAAAMYEHGSASGMQPENPDVKRPEREIPKEDEVTPVSSIHEAIGADMERPLPQVVKDLAVEQYSSVLDQKSMALYQGTVRAVDKLNQGYDDLMNQDTSKVTAFDNRMGRIVEQYHDVSSYEAVMAAAASSKLEGEMIHSEHSPGSDAWNEERNADIQSVMDNLNSMRAAGAVSTMTLSRTQNHPDVSEALRGTLSQQETGKADRGRVVANAALEAAYDRVVNLEDAYGYVPDKKTQAALGPMYEDYRTSRRAAENRVPFAVQNVLEQQAKNALSSPEGVRDMLDNHEKSVQRAAQLDGMDTSGFHGQVSNAVRNAKIQAHYDGITKDLMLRGMMQNPKMSAQRDAAGKSYRDFAENFYNKHLSPDMAASYQQDMFNAKSVLNVMNQSIVDAAQSMGKARNANGRYSVGTKDLVSHMTKDLNNIDLKQGANVQDNNKMLRDMMDKATLMGECASAGSRVYSGKDGGVAQQAVRNTLTGLDGKLLDAAGKVAVRMEDEVFKKAAAMELSGQKLDKETKKALGPEYARQKKEGLFDKVRQEYADKGQPLEKPSRLSSFMSGIQDKIKSMVKDASKEPVHSTQSRPDTEAFNKAFGAKDKEQPQEREAQDRTEHPGSQARPNPEKVQMSQNEEPSIHPSVEKPAERRMPHGFEEGTGHAGASERRMPSGFSSTDGSDVGQRDGLSMPGM